MFEYYKDFFKQLIVLAITLALISFILSIFDGCSSVTEPEEEEVVDWLCCYDNTGQVVHINDVSYGIQDGVYKYYPLNLEEEYKIDGMLITFNFDSMYIVSKNKLWGLPIMITDIKEIDSIFYQQPVVGEPY